MKINNFLNFKKEIFTLSVLKYNREINKLRSNRKFFYYENQVNNQEFFLYCKYNYLPIDKDKDSVYRTIEFLTKQFHSEKNEYKIKSNGDVIYNKEKIESFYIEEPMKLPRKMGRKRYCKVKKREYIYIKYLLELLLI